MKRTSQLFLLLFLISHSSVIVGQTSTDTRKELKNGFAENIVNEEIWSVVKKTGLTDTINKVAFIDGKLYDAVLSESGDTVPMVSLGMVDVKGKRVFKTKREKRKYRRLERHIRKVYPFAKLANEKLMGYEKTLTGMDEKKRKKFMRIAEKEIRKEFSNDLKALTFTQGRILLKLIDRETGNVSYELVKDLRGGFTAWLFQGVARMFDFNLKAEYDPDNDDKLIEEIVAKIDQEEAIQQAMCVGR